MKLDGCWQLQGHHEERCSSCGADVMLSMASMVAGLTTGLNVLSYCEQPNEPYGGHEIHLSGICA